MTKPRPAGRRGRGGVGDSTAQLAQWLELCQLEREDVEFFTALVGDSA